MFARLVAASSIVLTGVLGCGGGGESGGGGEGGGDGSSGSSTSSGGSTSSGSSGGGACSPAFSANHCVITSGACVNYTGSKYASPAVCAQYAGTNSGVACSHVGGAGCCVLNQGTSAEAMTVYYAPVDLAKQQAFCATHNGLWETL